MGEQGGGGQLNPQSQLLHMQKQLRTNAPAQTKVPASTGDHHCLICGEKVSDMEGTCGPCSSKRKWDISNLTVPLFILSIMGICLSFLILVNQDQMLSSFEIDLSDRSDVGFIFMILTLVTAMALSWQRRKAISLGDPYRSILPLMAVTTLPLPMVLISMDPSSILILGVSILLIVSALAILLVFRKEAMNMGPLSFLFITLGSIFTLFGLMFSLRDIELTGLIWFLSGKHVAFIGIIFLAIGAYLTISRISLVSKSASTSIFFSLSAVVFLILVMIRDPSGEVSDQLELLMVVPFLFLTVSTSSFLAEAVNDLRIKSMNDSMKEAMKRSEDLEGKNRIFYSIQQIDRAIRTNPVDGFGRTIEHSSVIFKMEGPALVDDFTFIPSEIEISLNEKAKILSSQGKFPDAAKEYQEAIKRSPEFIETYQNLGMLLSSIPGKKKEAGKHIDYVLGSKEVYIKRWMRHGLPTRYAYWMADSMALYRKMLKRKSDLLFRLSKEGDVWAYYSLVRY